MALTPASLPHSGAGPDPASGARPVVGVDIGGTTTQTVRLDAGEITATDGRPTPLRPDALVTTVVDAVAAVLADGELPARIGIGVPGQVDPVLGQVRHAVNLGIGSDPLRLTEHIRGHWPVPIRLENDVRAAALGTVGWLAGHQRRVPDLAYLSIGTGISAGVVIGGRIHRGRDGLAGEIGHVPVVIGGPPCACGLDGCLEAVASGAAIARRWPSPDGRSAEALFATAAAGDPRAAEIAAEIAGHLAGAVHWLIMSYGVDVVVLGGGAAAGDGPVLHAVRARLADRAARSELARHVLRPDRVLTAPADRPIGALGAAALVADADAGTQQVTGTATFGKEDT